MIQEAIEGRGKLENGFKLLGRAETSRGSLVSGVKTAPFFELKGF